MHAGKHTKMKKPRYRDDNGAFPFFFRRSEADSNRCSSFCRAEPSHSAIGPLKVDKYTTRRPKGYVPFRLCTLKMHDEPHIKRHPLSLALRKALPNALTLGNLFCGLAVCWWAASEFDPGWAPLEIARHLGIETWFGGGTATGAGGSSRAAGLRVLVTVWMFGQLFDLLDGATARALKVADPKGPGAYLDSLADFVSSGVAPAFMGVALWDEAFGPQGWMLLPLGVVVAAGWRLARFHAEDQGDRPGFEGMPAPMAALWWGATTWALAETLGPGGVDGLDWVQVAVVLGSTVVPLMMVWRRPFLSFKGRGENRALDQIRGGFLLTALVLLVTSQILAGSAAWGALVALALYPLWSLAAGKHLSNS